MGFGKYIFVSLLTQRVVERMIGWLTVGKLATSVFHCWRGEEHTLLHTHYYSHITTHTYTLGCPKKNKSLNFGTQLTPLVFIGKMSHQKKFSIIDP